MKRLAIIDADSMIYIVAYKFRAKKVANMVKINLNQFISELLSETKATHYVGFFGASDKVTKPNFRYEIDPNYKKNRPETPDFITKWRPTIHQEMMDHWGFVPVMGIEADDAVSIAYNQYKDEYDEVVIITADKDLKQIPNTTHFDMNKHKFTPITEFEAYKFFAEQMLKGDTTDNIKGLPGIGPKKAADLVETCTTKAQLKWMIMRMYKAHFDKTKVEPDIEKEASEAWEEYLKGLNTNQFTATQLERQKRLFLKGFVNKKKKEKATGWREYITQQYQLLHMLTEAPEDFEVPEPAPYSGVVLDEVDTDEDDGPVDLLGL